MTDWNFTRQPRRAPGHVSTVDLDQFGRRLRLGEPVDPADVDRMEAACHRIARQAPIGANSRQTALRVLRAIGDLRRAQQTTIMAKTDGTLPPGSTASNQEGRDEQ